MLIIVISYSKTLDPIFADTTFQPQLKSPTSLPTTLKHSEIAIAGLDSGTARVS